MLRRKQLKRKLQRRNNELFELAGLDPYDQSISLDLNVTFSFDLPDWLSNMIAGFVPKVQGKIADSLNATGRIRSKEKTEKVLPMKDAAKMVPITDNQKDNSFPVEPEEDE